MVVPHLLPAADASSMLSLLSRTFSRYRRPGGKGPKQANKAIQMRNPSDVDKRRRETQNTYLPTPNLSNKCSKDNCGSKVISKQPADNIVVQCKCFNA
eukprot:5073503-Amphidinium_carterae.1